MANFYLSEKTVSAPGILVFNLLQNQFDNIVGEWGRSGPPSKTIVVTNVKKVDHGTQDGPNSVGDVPTFDRWIPPN